MKKNKTKIVFAYDLYIKNKKLFLSDIFKKIGYDILSVKETSVINDDEFYFVIFKHIFMDMFLPKTEEYNTELMFNDELEPIAYYLKGKTLKKYLAIKGENIYMKIPFEYAKNKMNVIHLPENEYIELLEEVPYIISFLYKANYLRLYYEGVDFVSFDNILIDWDVKIKKGAIIYPNTVLKGNTIIEKGAVIHPFTYIENSEIGENAVVYPFTHIVDSKLEKNSSVGPYSRLRKNTIIKEGAKTGDFVEMKNTTFGKNSKAMHLSYIGDATVGEKVNIGAGTITCNYDGEKKHPTIIENNVFIGSGTELVAPVKIEKNSYIGAGSTITKDVPANSLAIARERQENKKDWVLRRKKKK